MNACMQAIGDANHEAVLRSQSVDSITSLQETLGEAGMPQTGRAIWAAQWATVLVGRAAEKPSPICSDADVLPFNDSWGTDMQDDDLTLVVDVSHSVEMDRRRLEGEQLGSIASMEHAPPGGLRCRPARMNALILQAAAANRNAAQSVPKSTFWAALRYGPKVGAQRQTERGGLFTNLSVGRL